MKHSVKITASVLAGAAVFAGGWMLRGGGTASVDVNAPPLPPGVNPITHTLDVRQLPDMTPIYTGTGGQGYIKSSVAFAGPGQRPAITMVFDKAGKPIGFWDGRHFTQF